MAPLLAIAELSIAVGVVVLVVRSFRRHRVARNWWIALAAAAIIGAVVGVWFGFGFSCQPLDNIIVYSAPVPGGFYVLEKYSDGTQQWVDFITPAPMLVATGNAFLWLSFSVATLWLARRLVIGSRSTD